MMKPHSRHPGEPDPVLARPSELGERVKELTCLYEVAAIFAERRGSLQECLAQVVRVLPRACRFPEHAMARVRLDQFEVPSPEEAPAPGSPCITAPLRVAGRDRGEVTLAYTQATPANARRERERAEGLFLGEERALLDTVAHQIGVLVGSVEAEQHRSEMEVSLRHADRLATIGELAAGVAHELNEPLGNVLGFAQLSLKAPDLPEQVRTDLGRIEEAALHGREIIRKLLVFARQAPASKQPIALNAVVEEAMFLLEAGCDRPGIRFTRKLGDKLPAFEADPVQIRQVVTNLVINAMQAIPDSGTITVRTTADVGATELSVSDTGSGMAPEVRRRVFDPFFTTKDVGLGTGLGLAVVQGIVAGHGGSIEVESKVGCGTVFRVRLPAGAPVTV